MNSIDVCFALKSVIFFLLPAVLLCQPTTLRTPYSDRVGDILVAYQTIRTLLLTQKTLIILVVIVYSHFHRYITKFQYLIQFFNSYLRHIYFLIFSINLRFENLHSMSPACLIYEHIKFKLYCYQNVILNLFTPTSNQTKPSMPIDFNSTAIASCDTQARIHIHILDRLGLGLGLGCNSIVPKELS